MNIKSEYILHSLFMFIIFQRQIRHTIFLSQHYTTYYHIYDNLGSFTREEQISLAYYALDKDFNPRSLRGATWYTIIKIRKELFQSTFPQGATSPLPKLVLSRRISIHVPLGSDNVNFIVHEIKEKSKFFANPYK